MREKVNENGRNRYQLRIFQRLSRYAPVTGKCYMRKTFGKWELYVPEFQVLGQNGYSLKNVLRSPKMTNQLHIKKLKNVISNDSEET